MQAVAFPFLSAIDASIIGRCDTLPERHELSQRHTAEISWNQPKKLFERNFNQLAISI